MLFLAKSEDIIKQMTPKVQIFLYEDCIIKTLYSIWDSSVTTVALAEKHHKKSLNALWGNYLPNYDASSNDEIYRKYNLAYKHQINRHPNQGAIASAYTSLLFEYYSIDEIWISGDFEYHKLTGMEFKNFYARNLSSEIKKEPYFINQIIPGFFRLLHKKMQLDHLLTIPKGVPSNQTTRVVRASKAAQAKNFGEDILKNRILSFFNSQNIEKEYTSLPKILDKLSGKIEIIFNDYVEIMNRSVNIEGRRSFFGKDSDLMNIEKTIRRWINDDDNFHDAVQRICFRKIRLKTKERDKSLLNSIKNKNSPNDEFL